MPSSWADVFNISIRACSHAVVIMPTLNLALGSVLTIVSSQKVNRIPNRTRDSQGTANNPGHRERAALLWLLQSTSRRGTRRRQREGEVGRGRKAFCVHKPRFLQEGLLRMGIKLLGLSLARRIAGFLHHKTRQAHKRSEKHKPKKRAKMVVWRQFSVDLVCFFNGPEKICSALSLLIGVCSQ